MPITELIEAVETMAKKIEQSAATDGTDAGAKTSMQEAKRWRTMARKARTEWERLKNPQP